MNSSTLNLYTLGFSQGRSYLFAALFLVGNIVLPQLCHLMPQGGLTLLPIYFFTLIGAYKYGWKVGLMTAVFSPLVNSALFGMPAAAVLPGIMVKSVLLALSAAFVARRYQSVSIPLLLLVVLGYQVVGSLIESAMLGSLTLGFQDFRIGIPGMLLQVVGGYFVIKSMNWKMS
ncbi:MAG: ECF transporter S component [Prevotella sp.]|nr:ECF transporter S component [Prevotella sp.]